MNFIINALNAAGFKLGKVKTAKGEGFSLVKLTEEEKQEYIEKLKTLRAEAFKPSSSAVRFTE